MKNPNTTEFEFAESIERIEPITMPRKRKGVTAAQQRERHKRQQNHSVNDPLQNHQSEQDSVKFTHKPDAYKVISGTIHQGDTRFKYPGIQCAYISLIALIRMSLKDPKSWTPGHIDSCVIDGNARFLRHFEELDMEPKMLLANELPNLINISQKSFVCYQSESDIEVGLLKPNLCDADKDFAKSLEKALLERLDSSHTCLLFCGGLTIAVAKVESHFYTFDSHSRGKDGLLNHAGTAVVIVFDHLNDLIGYIEKLFLHSLKLRPFDQFELVPVKISPRAIESPENLPKAGSEKSEIVDIDTSYSRESFESKEIIPKQQGSPVETDINETSKCMETYFEDQKRRQKLFQEGRNDATATLHNRKEYMKMYMRKRREKETFRTKENDSNRSRMQKMRSTSEGKQKNRETANEGMRKYLETENGRLKHNQMSTETMRKRLCTSEGRSNHNERSAESMRTMLKDDEKRLKHRIKSAEALKRILTDEQRKQRHKEQSVEAMRRRLTDEQNKQRHKEQSIEAMRRRFSDEQRNQKHKAQSVEAMRRRLADEHNKQKHKEQSVEAMRRRLTDEQNKHKHKQQSVEAMRRRLTDKQNKHKHKQQSVEAMRRRLKDDQKKQRHKESTIDSKIKLLRDPDNKQKHNEKSADGMRKCLQDEQKRQIHRKRTADGMRKILSVEQNKHKHREKSAQGMKNTRKRKAYNHKEYLLKKKRKTGFTFEEAVNKFNEAIKVSCSYVCSSCHQTWFKQSVKTVSSLSKNIDTPLLLQCLTGYHSVANEEWICNTCINNIRHGKVPRLSVLNGMGFPEQIPELKLNSLEERLISLRIPFMQIRTLNSGGQFSLKGSVVNVPTEIEPTIRALPRLQKESETIPIKLKRMKELKNAVITENVRPSFVINALKTLTKTSEFYKEANISIDENWSGVDLATENQNVCNIDESTNDESDTFSEVEDEIPLMTFLDDQAYDKNTVISVAPGEGQRPLSIFKDPYSEYLSFPTLFCGQKRIDNSDRKVPVYYSDICKWELRSVDRRVALHIPNLFYKMKKLQTEQVCSKVHLAVRRCKTKGKTYTAGFILKDNMGESLIRLDEGYRIFRTIRNSPQYWEHQKKEVFAMIRQLGIPTLFLSFSANDLHWSELIITLGKLVDHKDYTEDVSTDSLSWETRSRLVQTDPVTCVRHFDHRVSQFIQTVLKSPNSPLGKMEDYFYRVEFQHRGSPHIHMLVWIKNSPKYGDDEEQDVIDYIDNVASCSSNVPSESKTYLAMQKHKHSRTCRKGGKAECRFGIPFPPMRETVILQPFDGEDRHIYEEHYKTVQKQLARFDDSITFDEFLKKVDLCETDYIKAVQTSITSAKVFLKRAPNDNRINPYINGMLSVWKGNHDVQFILDAYACAMYIVSYINKSGKGMSSLMAEACKEAKRGNQTLKQSVRHMGNKFLNAVEVSAQEAAYLILQQSLSVKSRGCEFIPTAPPAERTFLMKSKKELEALPDNSMDIAADNIVNRYSKRHMVLENYCLADFVSKVISVTKKKNEPTEQRAVESSDSEKDEGSDVEIGIESQKTRYSLDKGEFVIHLRAKPKIIRYVKYNKTSDKENYFREQLMLFYPWRNEDTDLLGGFTTYEERIKTVSQRMQEAKKQYDANSELLDEIEKATTETLTVENVSSNIECIEAHDAENEPVQSSKYVFYKPESREHAYYDLGADIGLATHLANDEIEMIKSRCPENEYFELLSKLNLKQRQIFTHIIHSMTFTPERQLFLFVTGGAGVGKSLWIRTLYQALHRLLCSDSGQNPEDIRIQMCSYTGLAAYNINGSTLHSAFGIEPNKKLLYKPLSDEKRNTFQSKFMHLSVLIIDEVSMVGNGMLNFLYLRLQEIKGNKRAFGGVHIILVGDLFQLRPVGDSWIFSDMSSGYATLAPNLWKQHFKMFELTEIMRQKDDAVFAELLNRIREGNQTNEDIALLCTRNINPTCSQYRELKRELHLFPCNAAVDSHNSNLFNELESEKAEINCSDTVLGEDPMDVKQIILKQIQGKKTSDTGNLSEVLKVALGLQYDTTHNVSIQDGICNGTPCVLKKIHYMQQSPIPSCLWVLFPDATIGRNTRKEYIHYYKRYPDVSKEWTPIWSVRRTFMFRRKAIVRQQFPLKASSAKTIHKAQGQTKSQAVVDMSSGSRPHQHYVAFSRVTSLNGLFLLNGLSGNIQVDNQVVKEMNRLRTEALVDLSYKSTDGNSRQFSVVFQNAQSLRLHIPLLQNDSTFTSADVICLAETRLCCKDQDSEFSVEGFQPIIRSDQSAFDGLRPSHGLAMYVKKHIEINLIETVSTKEFECLKVQLNSPHQSTTIIAVYKSPNCSAKTFKEHIRSMMRFHVTDKIIIVGDFNYDVSRQQNDSFLQFMKSVFPKTNVLDSLQTTRDDTRLDLCFTSFPNASANIVTCVWSFHHTLIVNIF